MYKLSKVFKNPPKFQTLTLSQVHKSSREGEREERRNGGRNG